MNIQEKILTFLTQGNPEKVAELLDGLSIPRQNQEFEKALDLRNITEESKKRLFEQVLKRSRPNPEETNTSIAREEQMKQAKEEWKYKYHNRNLSIADLKSPPDDLYMERDRYIDDLLSSKMLSPTEVKMYVDQHLLDPDRAKSYLLSIKRTPEEIRAILKIANEEVTFPATWFSEKVSLKAGINDLLVIGNATAGKTSFLASFMNFMQNKKPNFELLNPRSYGHRYGSVLIKAAGDGKCFGGTVKYRAINMLSLMNPQKRYFPCNIVDLPGEAFTSTFSQSGMKMPPNFESVFLAYNNDLPYQNPKVLLFTIAVDQPEINISEKYNTVDEDGNNVTKTTSYSVDVDTFYQSFLTLLHEKGIMHHVVGIGIIATKWDKSQEFGYFDKSQFIKKVCSSMNEQILSWQDKFYKKLKYETFTYSIGAVDEELKSYNHDPQGADDLYDWLIHNPRVLKELNPKGYHQVMSNGKY
ncbi:MAG: hypothetical protein AAGA77_21785 [Bacteroidota bacterium]